jgi:cyclohexyl-isocyanide hydratase
VTAGIDMALSVLAEIAGPEYAQTVQLAIEYAPMPPFDSGRPECARPQVVAAAKKRLDAIRDDCDAAVLRAARSLRSGVAHGAGSCGGGTAARAPAAPIARARL